MRRRHPGQPSGGACRRVVGGSGGSTNPCTTTPCNYQAVDDRLCKPCEPHLGHFTCVRRSTVAPALNVPACASVVRPPLVAVEAACRFLCSAQVQQANDRVSASGCCVRGQYREQQPQPHPPIGGECE